MVTRLVVAAVLVAAFAVAPAAWAADTTASDVTTDATAVDVTEAPATVMVTMHLVDPEGVQAAFAGFRPVEPFGDGFGARGTLLTGTPTDGIWSVAVPVPMTAVTGLYRLGIETVDGAETILGLPQAQTLAVQAYVDTTPPSISEIDVSPATIDVREAPADVTVKARLTDDRFLDFGDAAFYLHPFGASVFQPQLEADFILMGGDLRDGHWATTITIPKGTAPGDYHLYVFAQDWLMHRTWLNPDQPLLHIVSGHEGEDGATGSDAFPDEAPADEALTPVATSPEASVVVPPTQSLTTAIRSGLAVTARCSEACRISPELRLGGTALAHTSRTLWRAGKARIRMRLPARAARRIRRAHRSAVVLRTTIGFSGARDRIITRRVRLH